MNFKNHGIINKVIVMVLLIKITLEKNYKNKNSRNVEGSLAKLPTIVKEELREEIEIEKVEDNEKKEERSFKPIFQNSHILKAKIEELVFCGKDMERIALLTSDSKVIHTKNFGKKWDRVYNEFDTYHSSQNMKTINLIQNPNNQEQIIFIDNNFENLITNDCGDSY